MTTIKRAAASPRGRPLKNDHAVRLISQTDKPELRPGQIVDRWGHSHYSELVFTNWSPAALKACGIRRIESSRPCPPSRRARP